MTFDSVVAVALTLPDVELATRYDGSRAIKARGCFMAGLASHPSSQPESLVVRMDLAARECLLDDAPETYYVTDYYRPHPVVLVRLSHLHPDALVDLLSVAWRLTIAKGRSRRPVTGAAAAGRRGRAAYARPRQSRRSR